MARKSSVADSEERDRDGTKIRELVAILRLSEQALTDMPWTENPCVGDSIPPKDTNLNNHLHGGFFFGIHSRE
jgi:hypothetical protein